MKQRDFLKEEKAITLIALIITIIVMLILAGVTINLTLGENGIFTTAQKAAKNYTDAQEKEQVALEGFTNLVDKTINSIENGVYYTTDEIGNTIPVPIGFSPITTEDQGTKDTGFVIKNDRDGNEFVWIPVESIENYKRVGWTREGWNYRQTLDDETGRITRADLGNEVYWTELMPEDEAKSVSAYGGFYIARYEAGVKDYETKNTIIDGTTIWTGYIGENTTLVIQDEQEVWNYITRDKAIAVVEDLYSKEIDNVTSKLCSSYAWDTALKFIEKQNSIYPTNGTGGNYNSATGGTGTLQLTGYQGVNNIYDMGGNAWEWTTESYSDSSLPYVYCGGGRSYSALDAPAARRGKDSATVANDEISFRVALYL